MDVEAPPLPSWLRWEKHRHRALVGLAIVASTGIAAAASNERRLFLLPDMPMAFAAIAAPEPTALRSAVMGYLDDGCEPDMEGASGGFDRAIDGEDCGRERKRPPRKPAPEMVEPAAFLAVPDDPIPFESPLLVINDLPIEALRLPMIGGGPAYTPVRPAGSTPPALVSGIPEPGSWALMFGGFALAGAALRRRPDSAGRLAGMTGRA